MTHLTELISSVRRRWFATAALRTVGAACGAASLPVLAAVLLERMLEPAGVSLVVLGTAAIVLAVAGASIVASRMARRPDDRRVARFIEERAVRIPGVGPLDDCVVSAVDARASATHHEGFATLIAASASRRLEGIAAHDLVSSGALRRSGAIALGGGLCLALAVVLGMPSLRRAMETARLQVFPQAVTVEVFPGNARLVTGHSLKIQARVRAGGRDITHVSPHLVVTAGADERIIEMERAADGFAFEIASIDRTFRYRVRTGSVLSPEFTVTALVPPRVQRIDVRYDYPSFSNLSTREVQDGGDVYGPAGTRVRLRIHTDKPIASGHLTLSSGTVALKRAGSAIVDAEFVLSRDDAYRVRLLDVDGLTADSDSEYFIRLMDD
ncbi:MAG TPA: hypothetical protein VNJ03_07725, partial [Vicinamibacterales bacterium]|nr:hypothetical protein [Vicinamibacterales bacterium]